MTRRLLLCLAGLLILAAPAAGEDIHRRKQRVDQQISFGRQDKRISDALHDATSRCA
jgi:hypothetical protein